jgi:predicted ester cyclase
MQDECRIAALWTVVGTHAGGPMNIPATGRTVRLHGASFFEVAAGRIVRANHVWDTAGLLRALGLLPDL